MMKLKVDIISSLDMFSKLIYVRERGGDMISWSDTDFGLFFIKGVMKSGRSDLESSRRLIRSLAYFWWSRCPSMTLAGISFSKINCMVGQYRGAAAIVIDLR